MQGMIDLTKWYCIDNQGKPNFGNGIYQHMQGMIDLTKWYCIDNQGEHNFGNGIYQHMQGMIDLTKKILYLQSRKA